MNLWEGFYMSWICKNCGNEISEEDTFCRFCGVSIRSSSKKNDSSIGIILLLIVMAIIVAFTIMISIEYDESTDSASEYAEENNANEPELPQGPFAYSIGGITFNIPEDYYYVDGTFISDYSKLVFTNEKIDDFWSVYLLVDNTAFNDIADKQVGNALSNSYRELSQSTHIAGNKSLLYVYSGELDDDPVRIFLAIIFSSNSESCVYVIYETPDDSNFDINDFEYMLNDSEITGAADSTSDPRSIFYIDEEQTVEE